MRGADIPGLLRKIPRSAGIFASDNLDNQPANAQALRSEYLMVARGSKAPLRYGLICRPDEAEDVIADLQAGMEVPVGTSSPGVVDKINRRFDFNMTADPDRGGWIAGGQCEKLLGLLPIRAVVDLVETGQTIKELSLVQAIQDLWQPELRVAWQPEPINTPTNPTPNLLQ